jgi:hypothetical protein
LLSIFVTEIEFFVAVLRAARVSVAPDPRPRAAKLFVPQGLKPRFIRPWFVEAEASTYPGG